MAASHAADAGSNPAESIMKEFILRARKAKTGFIDMDNLPKEGKIDSVCAAITNTLWISGDVRKDAAIHVVMEGPDNGPKTVSFYGNEIRGLKHDEKSMADYLKFALSRGAHLRLNEEAHVRTGIKIAKKSFERLVYEKSQQNVQMIFLDREGKDIRGFKFQKDFVVIFGSPEGLSPKTEKFLASFDVSKVSLGPRTLFAAQCPIIVHNETDRRGL